MHWVYTPYALPLFVSAALTAALAAYVWHQRATATGGATLALLSLSATEYALCYALELLGADLATKLLLAKVEYLGLATIPALFLAFALQYAGIGKQLSRRNLAVLAAVPAVTFLLALTNEWHGLVWPHAALQYVGSTAFLVLGHGPAFYAFTVTSYGFILATTSLFAGAVLGGLPPYRQQGILLLTGLLIPVVTNAAYGLDLFPVRYLNPTPMAFSLSVPVLALGMFRFRLLELVPVARQTLVSGMRDGVMVVDDRGSVVDLNPSLERILGWRARQAIGKPAAELLARWPEVVARLRDGTEEEVEIVLGDGVDRRHYVLGVSPMRVQTGPPAGRLIVLHDISEIKRLEAQFVQAQKMETIGRLAAGVAHDFNNLLTAITGYASFAMSALPPTNPVRRDLDQILKSTERAARLTYQLLAFSRHQVSVPQVLNLNKLILGMDRLLSSIVGEDVELVIQPAADLGLVKADAGQMEQVLFNLVVNACDAMPNGGKLTIATANVTVDEATARQLLAAAGGEFVTLVVSDTGVGMSEGVKAHLFEPFFTTKEVGKGTGLGLATVFGIVKQHQGSIWVDSHDGQGTTFTIYLPRVAGEPDDLLPDDDDGY